MNSAMLSWLQARWTTHRQTIAGAGAVAGAMLVGLIDWLTGPEIVLNLFYVLVVWLATVGRGLRWGLVIAGVCMAVDLATDAPFLDDRLTWAIHLWNALVRGAVLVVLAVLAAKLNALPSLLERKVAERTAELRQSNRTLRMLSDCSDALVHAADEQQLLHRFCRIIVEPGGYRRCWVGYAGQDEAKSIRPVAQVGFEDGYLRRLNLTWADTERGDHPSGIAIRTGQPCVARDLPEDPGSAPQGAEAVGRGHEAVIALPLQNEGKALGVLNIFAAAPDAFGEAETKLLDELANDLAFGIVSQRIRAAKGRAETALRESDERTRLATETTGVGIWEWNVKTGTVAWDAQMFRLYGLEPAPGGCVDYREWRDAVLAEDRPQQEAILQETVRRGGQSTREFRIRRRSDGQVRVIHAVEAVRTDAAGNAEWVVGTNLDVTERREAEAAQAADARRVKELLEQAEKSRRALVGVLEDQRRATDALRESEARFASAFEFAAVGKALVAPDGRWLKVNRALCELTGYTADELQTKSFQDITHPDDLQTNVEFARQMLAGERETCHMEKRYLHRQGRIVWVLVSVSLLRDAERRPLYFITEIQDITGRREAEAALHESHARFNRLVRELNDIVWSAPLDGSRITDLNDSFENVYGISAETFRANPRLWLEMVHPADRAIAEQSNQTLRATGKAVAEYRIVRPDGQVRWLLDRKSLIRDASGRPIELGGIAKDITEQKRAEEQLRLQSDALQATANAIVICDRDGMIRWVNHAFTGLTGYNAEEAVGQNCRLLKSGRQDTAFYERMWRTILAGQPWEGEIVNQRKDGSLYTEWLSITPVRDRVGEIAHFIAVGQDITDAKENQRRLHRSQRLESLGTLAGGIAHDLNNALAPILMTVELMRMERPEKSQTLDIVQASARRAADMVKQLLTFAKGSVGARVSTNPNHLLKELQGIIQSTFPKNIELMTRVEPGTPTVLADTTQLHQVLLNLCVNARDAMPQGGRLTLEAEQCAVDAVFAAIHSEAKTGDYVVFRVRDTGTGISPEVMDRIFEPFFTTKGPAKGTGLGLSTSLGIVKGHGGFIRIYSEPGKGSTFEVYLPAEAETRQAELTLKAADTYRGRGQTILFVDDEAGVRAAGCAVLLKLGFKPLTAADGAEGIQVAVEHRTDLNAVILDLQMPHMDGLVLARALRRLRPDLPIAAMSGRFDEVTDAELAQLGVSFRLAKPFTEAQLTETLARLLTAPLPT